MDLPSSLHALLLLSDSALPLGSFAFSSGLESYLGHRKPPPPQKVSAFKHFLRDSLENLASTSLPFVLSAYDDPTLLEDLDNDFDAGTPCTVARRASIAQGRALLAIWERALCASVAREEGCAGAGERVSEFAAAVKSSSGASQPYGLQFNAHFPSLFGAVARAVGLDREETAYLFLLNHAKALLSAAVRASVMGPYQSQAVLAGSELRGWIRETMGRYEGCGAAEAAVTVPVMDLWMGRHELLYSRIFNS